MSAAVLRNRIAREYLATLPSGAVSDVALRDCPACGSESCVPAIDCREGLGGVCLDCGQISDEAL